MKYIRKFNSHELYEAATIDDKPSVVYDSEHVHYIQQVDEDGEEDEEQTKYKLSVFVNDLDNGEISTYDYSFAENDTINESIEHLSIISYSYTISNADTNAEIADSLITVTQSTNGFTISGTMPEYNAKINISVSSLA